jgi:lactoylglutathione lyase
MPSLKKLLHTRMRVDDIDRTVKFYTEILGLEIEARRESPRGAKLVFLRTPNSDELLEITYFPDSGPVKVQPDLMHLAFEVENLQEYCKYLESKGIKLTDGPTVSKSTGSVFAFIDAPEGYEIELIQRGK